MDFKTLISLPPEAFLKHETFRTPWDGMPSSVYREQRYRNALAISKEAEWRGGHISISEENVWGAFWQVDKDHDSSISSYERIGYHGCSSETLRGLLDGYAPIRVYRKGIPGFTVIKKAG